MDQKTVGTNVTNGLLRHFLDQACAPQCRRADHLKIVIAALPKPLVESKVARGLWSIRRVKCPPQRRMFHQPHTHTRTLIMESFLSQSVRDLNANVKAFSESPFSVTVQPSGHCTNYVIAGVSSDQRALPNSVTPRLAAISSFRQQKATWAASVHVKPIFPLSRVWRRSTTEGMNLEYQPVRPRDDCRVVASCGGGASVMVVTWSGCGRTSDAETWPKIESSFFLNKHDMSRNPQTLILR